MNANFFLAIKLQPNLIIRSVRQVASILRSKLKLKIESKLHKNATASQTLPLHLMEVIDVAFKVTNFIRSRTKNHQFFQLLAKEMGKQHVGLSFYTKVRWLSRVKCLSVSNELKNEVEIFLRENKNNLHVQFHNEEFVVMHAYLAVVPGRVQSFECNEADI